MTINRPSVRVLLATYNGDRWLDEQLASLLAQVDVQISIYASDDQSTDRTPAILAEAAAKGAVALLPALPHKFGSANRNFLRLIRDTPVDDVAYFAFSDQDDIWLPAKLSSAVAALCAQELDAFSSNVTAFWPDGRQEVLLKSQRQRKFDHLFESAGPGCTFVLRRSAFIELQRWVRDRFESLQEIKVHDWLIYAYGRERGWRWSIADQTFMLYRQHERNEAGANAGWRAALRRLRSVFEGRFRLDALAIGDAVGCRVPALQRLRRLAFRDRLCLAANARQYRRSFRDAMVLGLLFLVMPRQP